MNKNILPIDSPSFKSGIVLTSAINIMRNIDGLKFPDKLGFEQQQSIESLLTEISKKYSLDIIDVQNNENLTELASELQISPDILQNIRTIYIQKDSSWLLIPNHENHINICSLSYGLNLKNIYKNIKSVLDDLDMDIYFDYIPDMGFTTANINYAGNGLYMSVLLNLTGIELKNQVPALIETCKETGYILEPYTKHPNCGLFILKNAGSFGISENEHIDHMIQLIQKIQDIETQAKNEILSDEENKALLIGQVSGYISCDTMSYSEAIDLISVVDFLDKSLYSIKERLLWVDQLFRLRYVSEVQRAGIIKTIFRSLVSFKGSINAKHKK